MRLILSLTLVVFLFLSSCVDDHGCEVFDSTLFGCKTYPVLHVDTSMKDWFAYDSGSTFCMKNNSGSIHCWLAQGGWEFDTLLHNVNRREDYQVCGTATCYDKAYFQTYSLPFRSTQSPLSIRLGVRKNFTEDISDSTAVMNLGDIRTVEIKYNINSRIEFPAAESLQQIGRSKYGFLRHSTLVLHGISFNEVFEFYSPMEDASEIQACYFTKTQGLIGFRLKSGEVWRLE